MVIMDIVWKISFSEKNNEAFELKRLISKEFEF